jgi:hypothetical protein
MAQLKTPLKETPTMSRKQTYQATYDELFAPALGALRGIAGLDSRQHHTVAGLLAEVAGRAAERISRKR